MKIAIASGKGGTGKTTVATSLAASLVAPPAIARATLIDCDVEAPNAHLFLKPEIVQRQDVALQIPQVNETRCTHCGKCAEVCQYHAIAVLGKRVMVFPQLCHGCGSCTALCPEHAISEIPNVMGVLERGTAGEVVFARGIMNVGEPMAVPVIRQLKKWMASSGEAVVILDAPPGTSCPVVEVMRDANYLLLVTEPTPFGLHDVKLAAQVAQELNLPAGVIINRDGIGDAGVEEFCQIQGLPILMRIPFDRTIAQGVAQGQLLTDIYPPFINKFRALFAQIAVQVEFR